MSWVFLDGTKFITGQTAYEMAIDGGSVWVTTSQTLVKIYNFLGDGDGSEDAINLSAYLDDARHLLKVYDQMFVFDNAVSKFVRIDINTKTVIGQAINMRYSTNCIPAYGKFKIWFVTDEEDGVQSLYYYDTRDGSWSTPVPIPGKHQFTKRKIVWGKSNYIYVTQINESGVAKFDADTGAFILQQSTNRMSAGEEHIIVNDAREIVVCGYNGMVTSINQDTNNVTNISGLNASVNNFIDDGTYLWTIKPSAARITKGTSTDNYLVMASVPVTGNETHSNVFATFGFALREEDVTSVTNVEEFGAATLIEGTDYIFELDATFNEQRLTIIEDAPNISSNGPLTIRVSYNYNTQLKDYNIIGFEGTTFTQVLEVPGYTHEYWDGTTIQTKTEPQRIAFLSTSKLYVAYNLTDSWNLVKTRDYNLSIKGTALVGTGANAYHGETQ